MKIVFLNETLPDTADAFGKLKYSIFADGELDLKTKELIAITSSVLKGLKSRKPRNNSVAEIKALVQQN
jgi:alkylhydroperoxidase/carboxymuconolactone decarboxylase family protein YurZ